MSRSSLLACLVSATLTAPVIAATANPAFTGIWRSNPDMSPAPSSTITYSRERAGLHFSNGGYLNYAFACNGQAAPTGFENYTSTCTQSDPNTFNFIYKAGDSVEETSTTKLFDQGRSLSDETIEHQADGSTRRTITVYRRSSGKPADGLVGTWKAAQRTGDPLTLSYRVVGDHILLLYPAARRSVDASLDGTPAPLAGPGVAPDTTISIALEAPDRLHLIERQAGKPLEEVVDTLSPDGDRISSVQWLAGKEAEKTTTIFEKQ